MISVQEFIADAGYFSSANADAVTHAGVDPYIATQRLEHNEQIPDSPQGRTFTQS